MTQPLAIVCYERLMPGSQLVNRLQDLKYRVLTVSDPALLAATARREMPLLLLADLATRGDIRGAIEQIKADPATSHLPVIAFAPDNDPALSPEAQIAGVCAVSENAVVNHLPQLLDQALHVD
jgi:hypothetical protein